MNGRIDHIVIATDNLISGTSILEKKLNTKLLPGGEHKVMSTHNKLLKLQSNMYLEVIANNPNADAPSRPRWFSLDELNIKEKIKNTPRALCWVLEVANLEDTVKKCGYNPGEILQLSRDDLTWKVTIPSDGKLIENGVLPILIEWSNDQHPSKKLNNSNISLNKLTLFHQEPNKIQKIISNLIQSDLIHVSEGLAKIEINLTTRNEKVVID
ncbi:MAG: hypothetical protein CFH15_01420 [Alphaproteobacteria bacterium MarineAlpha5_Bin5]|nr:MAG: hypothetical protein CFH15_01420 [Alphaproteobacteria bacterium MarineAlpha5_Bin5]PPR50010.1 MAG: hypothetical protein CFH14_00949 [Alphaproteobacteria bacterium MarineAlpha5_Bin4]|tara:strand:+ start:1579 stop:2214 length:636 start_codon:yes stop_codon:yes gene_type:complete